MLEESEDSEKKDAGGGVTLPSARIRLQGGSEHRTDV